MKIIASLLIVASITAISLIARNGDVFGRTLCAVCPTCCHQDAANEKVVWINKRTSDSGEGIVVR